MRNQLANFRNLITLADGTRVLLRPLATADCEALVEMFAHASAEDRRYLLDDVTNRELIAGWTDNLDYQGLSPGGCYQRADCGRCSPPFSPGGVSPSRRAADFSVARGSAARAGNANAANAHRYCP